MTDKRTGEDAPGDSRPGLVERVWAWILGHERNLALIATLIAIVGGLWAGGAVVLDWITPDPVPDPAASSGPASTRPATPNTVDANDVPVPSGTRYDAAYFEPTFGSRGDGDGSWGFWMPSRAVAEFPTMEVNYSFDGMNYEVADMSARFFVNENLAGKSLFLKIRVGNVVHGPFRYDFDFAVSAVSELVREAMEGWPFDKGLLVQPQNEGGFPVLVAYEVSSGSTNGLMVKAAVSMTVAQYLIDFGDGFYETFPVESDMGLKLVLARSIPWPADGVIGLKVRNERGETLGPSIIDIDAPRLARIHWSHDFNETEGVECERRNVGVDTGTVICRPGSSHNTVTWAGLSKVELGLSPENLNTQFDVALTEADLLTIRGGEYGDYTVWDEKTYCQGTDSPGCAFLVQYPEATQQVYARFHYTDGRTSDVQRIRVGGAPLA